MGSGRDKTFYGLQGEFRRKSLMVLAVLLLFYIVSFGVLVLMADAGIGLAFAKPRMFELSRLAGLFIVSVVFSLGLGAFHYYDAKNNGAAYILKRLSARPAEFRDRYHREMENVVEAVRLASGVPRARAVVIPDPAVNSLVVVEPDGTACVAMTEGLLAAFTRDEITAAAAHEMAHVARGDAVLMTFICALTDFYERLWEGLQPSRPRESDDIMPVSEVLIRLLGRFLSRERETLADAAAVEISRDPAALARAIFKAHLASGFVGEFRSAYAPLFIVSPDVPEDDGGRAVGWSGSHPPVMTRIKLLAELAHIAPEDVIRQVWDERARRESAKEIVSVHENAPVEIAVPRVSKPEAPGACPRCGLTLVENCYEGVYLGQCRRCGGHFVDDSVLPRLLVRTEVGFSEELRRKAHDFEDRFLRNPVNTLKINEAFLPQAVCPSCGGKMRIRPFSYQYFVPVDRCFSCEKTWFDADELEILQVLVEEAKK